MEPKHINTVVAYFLVASIVLGAALYNKAKNAPKPVTIKVEESRKLDYSNDVCRELRVFHE
jgi:hypothetical protein